MTARRSQSRGSVSRNRGTGAEAPAGLAVVVLTLAASPSFARVPSLTGIRERDPETARTWLFDFPFTLVADRTLRED